MQPRLARRWCGSRRRMRGMLCLSSICCWRIASHGSGSPHRRDLRQLLRHRHKMVCLRTSVRNQLQALAMGQGIYRKRKMWTATGRTELEGLRLDPWASRRRQELLQILDRLDPCLAELDRAVAKEAEQRPAARCLMEQPGVGAQTASRYDEELRRDYQRLKFRRGLAVAKVAIARKLAVRLYWKLRKHSLVPSTRMQGSSEHPVVGASLSGN